MTLGLPALAFCRALGSSSAAVRKSETFPRKNVSRTGNVSAENSSWGCLVAWRSSWTQRAGYRWLHDRSAGTEVRFLESYPAFCADCQGWTIAAAASPRMQSKKSWGIMHNFFFLTKNAEPLILSWWTEEEHACSLGNREEFWRIQGSQNVESVPPSKSLIAWVGEKTQACRFSIYLAGRTCNHFLSQVFCCKLAEGANLSLPRLILVRDSLTPFPSGLH